MSRIGVLAVVPLAALPAAAVGQVPPAPVPARLTLDCDGVVTHAGTRRSHRARAHDATASPLPADDAPPVRFVFEFDAGRGRVRFPATLVPVVHSGGDGGWWPVRDLDAGDDAFSGRIVLNLINQPRFTIDRHTGRFDLGGGLDIRVAGRCAPPSATPRLF